MAGGWWLAVGRTGLISYEPYTVDCCGQVPCNDADQRKAREHKHSAPMKNTMNSPDEYADGSECRCHKVAEIASHEDDVQHDVRPFAVIAAVAFLGM